MSGPKLLGLAEKIRDLGGKEQAVPFGATLHVSGEDEEALEKAIAPFRTDEYKWRQIEPGLEDIFIHLMERSKERGVR